MPSQPNDARLVQQAIAGERVARGHRDRVPEREVAEHLAAAQIEEAVFQTRLLAGGRALVHLEGQDFAGVEDLDALGRDFNLAGRQFFILRALGAATDGPRDANDPFRSQLGRDEEGGGLFGVDDDLNHAGAIAQVEEVDSPVVAARMHPARDAHRLSREGGVERAGVMSAQGLIHDQVSMHSLASLSVEGIR